MSWEWARFEAKFDGVEIQRVAFITAAGTWSRPDQGFQADVARALNDEQWQWIPVDYPASFGPVNPPFPGAPSYVDSVRAGVDAMCAAIERHHGRFVLSGYSQGAEVVARVLIELADGRLRHRRGDCAGAVTFGDPARQHSDECYGGGTGRGISRLVLPQGFRRVTYAVVGDMYCTTPDTMAGDQMHAVYEALTRLGTGRIDGHTALLAEVLRMLRDPVAGSVAAVDAIIRALRVRQHTAYAPWVPHAVAVANRMASEAASR